MQTCDLSYNIIKSPWGYLCAVWSVRGLYLLSFPQPNEEEALRYAPASAVQNEANDHADILQYELEMYFKGYKVNFSVPVDLTGYSPFAYHVLSALKDVPYGQKVTYSQLAACVGMPKAARAVGRVMAGNRTPILLPCHRVVGSNGKLVGFGGGLELKKALLLLEEQIQDV